MPLRSGSRAAARARARRRAPEDRHAAAHRRPHASTTRALAEQPGDTPTPVFSFLGRGAEHPRQVSCHITHTNERTHEIIRAGLIARRFSRAPSKASGRATARRSKTRSCASRISTRHQIFLEPEGLTTFEIYPNGISTSLPFDVQLDARAFDPGLRERARHAARLCDRVRLLRSARPEVLARDEGRSRISTSRGRSTARRDTRRRRRRASWPASMRRFACAAASRGPRGARKPTSACCRRPDHARRHGAVSHVHEPRRISALAARGQCRLAA